MITIEENSTLRFYLLNYGKLVAELLVSIPELKAKYPELFKLSLGILETFVNLCLDKWAEGYKDGWNVGMFDIIEGK